MADLYLTYSSMEAAAADINAVRTGLLTLLDDVQSEIEGLGSDFQTQTASSAYVGAVTDFVAQMTKAVTGLEGMTKLLTGTVDTFEQTDAALANGLKG